MPFKSQLNANQKSITFFVFCFQSFCLRFFIHDTKRHVIFVGHSVHVFCDRLGNEFKTQFNCHLVVHPVVNHGSDPVITSLETIPTKRLLINRRILPHFHRKHNVYHRNESFIITAYHHLIRGSSHQSISADIQTREPCL
jgi:hypothetical protein